MQTLGCLSLGSRFKRLSDKMYKDVASIYQEQDIDLHPSFFPLFNLLLTKGPLTVTQAAALLNVTHPAISKIAHKMQAEKLLFKASDPSDERRFFLTLDEKAFQLQQAIAPILVEMRKYLDSIIDSQQFPILKALTEFERAYDERGLINPVLNALANHIDPDSLSIEHWHSDLKADFYRLNAAWLNKYFNGLFNDLDRQALETPESYYLARGGYIWFAKLEQKIVGCIALANHDHGRYEISKMGVDEQYQGRGIGRKLMLIALQKARQLHANSLYLETSSLLPRALTLYQHMGFSQVEHPKGVSDYQRSDIYMELKI
ncbi:MAG: bifunctional helix-turn-helix transcriptional regulator/GNAT family N-acetyltransferase [Oceanospirillaceae bacterium]|nr:bifunctional helix-turn-helix transcriptional regulator/GNAT family N-acetyltransferase [Oceanospirillaceae bacterium]